MKNGAGVDAEVKRINYAISTKSSIEHWDYDEKNDIYSKVGCSFSFNQAVKSKKITVDSTKECGKQCNLAKGLEICSHFDVIKSGNDYTCNLFYNVKDGADKVTYSSTNIIQSCGFSESRTSQLLPL